LPLGRARRAIAGLAIAWVLGAPAVGRADVVELTNGQRIVGTITDVTEAGVRIEVDGRETRVPQADVRSIVFGAARATPPTPGPPDAAPAPSAPPPPAPTEAAVQPGTPPDPRLPPVAAALAALERLQAATATPLAPAEYAARVDEARRAATPAFGDAAVPDEILRPLGAAIRYHAFAALTRGDPAALAWDPLVADCRPLEQLAARETSRAPIDPKDPAVVRVLAKPEAARALRACAGEQIAEAERQARGRR
jgi:hypothetical protein